MVNLKKHWVFLVILLLAAFLRFYRLPEMAHFEFDQEYATDFAYSVVKVFPIQLIGQSLSVRELFMGPLYFYYLVPFFILTNLHPLGGFIGSVILDLITVIIYYVLGSRVFGQKTGLILASFRGLLTNYLEVSWNMTPAFSSDLLVIITWYYFYRFWQGHIKTLPILGFIFGLYTSFHPILFPFYLVFLVLMILKRKLPNLKVLLLSFLTFLIPLTPLIIFEYLHKFLELKRFLELFGHSGGKENLGQIGYFIQINFTEIYRVLALFFIPKYIFLIALFSLIILLIIKKVGFWKESFHLIFPLLTLVIFIIYYTLSPTHVPEYYFTGSVGVLLIYVVASLVLLSKYKLGKIFLVFFIFLAFLSNLFLLKGKWENPYLSSLHYKDATVQAIIEKVPQNKEFFVSYITPPGWNFGYNYLFKYYGRIPQTKEAKPPIFTIVTPKYLSADSLDLNFGNIGIILPK